MGPGVKMIIAHRATNAPLTNIGLARLEEHPKMYPPKLYPGPMIPPARYLPPPFADNIFRGSLMDIISQTELENFPQKIDTNFILI